MRYLCALALQVIMYQMLIHIHVLNAHPQLLIAISVLQLLLVILAQLDILELYVIHVIWQAFINRIQVLSLAPLV